MKTISVFCCLLYAAWTGGTRIDVEGFERGEVSFKCSHRLAWKNNKYLCKSPCKDSKDILMTVQSGKRVESDRMTLVDSGDGVFNVTFSQLQLSDSGLYWCGVDRPGLDSFITVHLTVKEAVETTTEHPPTYQTISSSTPLTSVMDSRPTNHSTASNRTDVGEQNISKGTVLYATIGAIAVLTILMLAAGFRKCRKKSKPQQQVGSSSTGPISADEREADCEYDDIGEVQSLKKLSERFSYTHRPKQDQPTSASTAADCSVPFHIYENICCTTSTAHSRYSTAKVQHEHDISSQIYINPLPPAISERSRDGSLGKHKTKPTATTDVTRKPTKSRTSDASARHSRSRSDSTVRPRSLWFGLDLSGAV